MLDLSIGLTALRANQTALNVVGQNIANANTPGYHRQTVRLVDRSPIELQGLSLGTGVDVAAIDRARSHVVEELLTTNISERSAISTRLTMARRLESRLAPGDGSLNQSLQEFLYEVERLSSNPADSSLRTIVIHSAAKLSDEINEFGAALYGLSFEIDDAIAETVADINARTTEIADLNHRIQLKEARGATPNDLLDRRDQLVNELAELIDVRVDQQVNNGTDPANQQSIFVLGGGAALTTRPVELHVGADQQGHVVIKPTKFADAMPVQGGMLGGLLVARNRLLEEYGSQVESFMHGLISAADPIHAGGVGTNGGFEFLAGQRGLSDVTVPLTEAQPVVPLTAGTLVVGVTDRGTGEKTLTRVSINPSLDSLQDVAATINAVDHIEASVDQENRRLVILAESGYEFDFTGGFSTSPDTSAITGDFVPTMEGSFSGPDDQRFTLEVKGSGTIGVTPGLTLEVRNAAGDVVDQLNVGEGYAPDAPLDLTGGIRVKLSAGAANDGDVFSVEAVSQADGVGILTALGLNTLFVGGTLTDFAVNPAIVRSPELLAMSSSGEPGNTDVLQEILALRDQPIPALGNRTLEETMSDIVSSIGIEVRDLDNVHSNLALVEEALLTEREGISGVDPNEELVKMLQYQRAFQSAARYISTIDEAMQELFNIIR